MWNLHAVSDGFGPSAQLVMVLVAMQELPDGVTMAVVIVNVGRSEVLIGLLDGDAVGVAEVVLPSRLVMMLTITLTALDESVTLEGDVVGVMEVVLPSRLVRILTITLTALDEFAALEVATREVVGADVSVLVGAAVEEATELVEATDEFVADGETHAAPDDEA